MKNIVFFSIKEKNTALKFPIQISSIKNYNNKGWHSSAASRSIL